MSIIDPNNSNVYQQINKANQGSVAELAQSKSQEDSDMFMKLMIAQLKNQDPTSPTDSSAFMEQISGMNQVESTNNLVNSVKQLTSSLLSSQSALQASSMVGQNVLISTDKTLSNSDGNINGMLSLPNTAENVRLTVTDANGSVIETMQLGAYSAGNNDFKWSGAADKAGEEFTLKAEALQTDGTYKRIDTYLDNKVTSVTLGQNGIGMQINTAVGSTAMDNVLRISG